MSALAGSTHVTRSSGSPRREDCGSCNHNRKARACIRTLAEAYDLRSGLAARRAGLTSRSKSGIWQTLRNCFHENLPKVERGSPSAIKLRIRLAEARHCSSQPDSTKRPERKGTGRALFEKAKILLDLEVVGCCDFTLQQSIMRSLRVSNWLCILDAIRAPVALLSSPCRNRFIARSTRVAHRWNWT